MGKPIERRPVHAARMGHIAGSDLMESSSPEGGRPLSAARQQRLHTALSLLRDARTDADEFRRDVWEFAIGIHELLAVGLTSVDLRWLAAQGCIAHGIELTEPGADGRSFRPAGNLAFTEQTCFVLTDRGDCWRNRLAESSRPVGEQNPVGSGGNGEPRPILPVWKTSVRELHWGGYLVKQFRLPAPNQELILSAFEEDGWPARIDDPLPQTRGQVPRERLHDAIRRLNHHQVHRLVFFQRDGTGQGVRWRIQGPGSAPRAALKRPLGAP
jgi:hypothetical protein